MIQFHIYVHVYTTLIITTCTNQYFTIQSNMHYVNRNDVCVQYSRDKHYIVPSKTKRTLSCAASKTSARNDLGGLGST